MENPNKIVFIGDTHFTANTPSSRKETNEEYRALQLKKLQYIYDLTDYNDWIIITGDVFHSSALSMMSGTPKFYNDLIDIMKSRRTFTIIGNHDMYLRNEDAYNTTILDNLFKTGVEHLKNESIYISDGNNSITVNLYGVDYNQDFPKLSSNNQDYNILVAHSFWEDSLLGDGNTNLTKEALEKIGYYDLIVLGHDHTAYPIMKVNDKTKVIRPGSLLRGTSHTCQINRIPQAAILDLQDLLDKKEDCIKYVSLPVAPGKEIFKERVILEKDIDVNIDNILNNMNSFDRTQGIYDFIKSQEYRGREVFGDRYNDIINLLKEYLNSFGIIEGI